MQNIFLFSSPLQYLFATLTARLVGGPATGYFYQYGRNFEDVYEAMDHIAGHVLDRNDIAQMDDPKAPFRLFIGNRFSNVEIDCFCRLRARSDEICLYEEGVNLYIDHFYLNKKLSDSNKINWLKNQIKRSIGKNPNQIYLREFSKIYSVFSKIPYRPNTVMHISLADEMRKISKNKLEKTEKKEALLLSQWFVSHNLLNNNEYFNFIRDAVSYIAQGYDKVYFKAHPRDPDNVTERILAELPVLRLPKDFESVPAELFLATNPSVDVFGFWTSAMFYSKHLYGSRSVSFFRALVERFADRSEIREMYKSVQPLLIEKGIEEAPTGFMH